MVDMGDISRGIAGQKISTKKEGERQNVWPFLPSWRSSILFQPHQLTRIQQVLTGKQLFFH
jgi:hypothetical protein